MMTKEIPAGKAKKSPTSSATSLVENRTLRQVSRLFKALADTNRLQILMLLSREGKLHVSKICETLDQSQPAISHHLTQLREAGLVESDREGKFNFYRIDSVRVVELLARFFPEGSEQTIHFGTLKLTVTDSTPPRTEG